MQFRHFPLHPETPESGQTLEDLFAGRGIDIAAAQRKMTALMQEEGLPYGDRRMTFNSRMAQEVAAWAETQHQSRDIHQALFQAYFVDGKNLADSAVLEEAVITAGLPADEAREVIRTRSFRQQVDDDWELSRQLRITGVPTFVAGQFGVSGAQPYETLCQLIEQAGGRPRS